MGKKILGLDLGSNSIGWALLEEVNGEANSIIDIGSRIFTKAVEEKVPTPKNVKRRDMRLGRRVLQRRARRKQRMLNYLVSLDLLSNEFYEDPRYWWVLAEANPKLGKGTFDVPPGVQLRIPFPKQKVLELYKSVNSSR